MKYELDTPCLVVDFKVLMDNITSMAGVAREGNVELRPHTKTHKCPEIARIQCDQGFPGITVAKLGEAEVMAEEGFEDILIAYPLVGSKKIERLYRLSEKINVISGVDSITGARGLSDYAEKHSTIFKVFLIVDTGKRRCGVTPDLAGLTVAKEINKLPGLEIKGIFTHEGHAYNELTADDIKKLTYSISEKMVSFAEDLKAEGIDVGVISIGSTPSIKCERWADGVNQVRPGTYVFNDYNLVKLGLVTVKDCALTVLTTVISKPAPDRLIIDAGSKSLTVEKGIERDGFESGYGFIKSVEGAKLVSLSEEHGIIQLGEDASEIEIGDHLEIIPNHVCPVVNLFDQINVVKGGQVINKWEIKGRGKVR